MQSFFKRGSMSIANHDVEETSDLNVHGSPTQLILVVLYTESRDTKEDTSAAK
jgi:hypothetical protein